MADLSEKRDMPFNDPNVRRRLMEHKRLRGLLTRAAAAARRRGDARAAMSYQDLGASRGIRVGGLDQALRQRQQVLTDMALEKAEGKKNEANRDKIEALAGRDIPNLRFPKVDNRGDVNKDEGINVLPQETSEQKEALQEQIRSSQDNRFGYLGEDPVEEDEFYFNQFNQLV